MAIQHQRERSWRSKFRNALRGIAFAVRGESSFFAHFFIAAIVCISAWILQLDTWQWCLVLIAIAAVLTAEMFNTSIEWLARAITAEYDERIGKALDISSGAVLVAAAGAATIGAIVFLPKLLAIVGYSP